MNKLNNNLLKVPLCSLNLDFSDSVVEKAIEIVRSELDLKGIKIELHFWISDEWFCPDGITGIAIPFYLLSKELIELEKQYIGYAEGEDLNWCLKLIRHEVAHALDNAYGLRELTKRAELFGRVQTPYPKEYTRRPYSKRYVINLEENYAQSHPEEDWAETFAVWLDPNSNWKKKYAKWPAIMKLEYVDSVMRKLNPRELITCEDTLDEISTLSITVEKYLERKLKSKNKYKKQLFGRNLNRIFKPGSHNNASSFLSKREKEICSKVAKTTNQYHYIVKDVFKELKQECKAKSLTLKKPSSQTKKEIEALLYRKTISYIKQGQHKVIM
ncbi:putative zinc-binding metallopeptidase [Halobacteriovorax sp. HLS]|uniref:putative zinc-binding metallopeptidase n=1 Tax=Halobacteriovorax sp. HLS TaxID=2234000 RepID=UPI000FDC3428|nr:putative zinc-binding metallopeptidase [Halobacteriovorax sp. HLS]